MVVVELWDETKCKVKCDDGKGTRRVGKGRVCE